MLRDILERILEGEISPGKLFLTGAVSIILALGFYGYGAARLIALLPDGFETTGMLLNGLLFIPFPFFILLWLALLWWTGRRKKFWPVLATFLSCIFLTLAAIEARVLAEMGTEAYSEILGDPQWGPRGIRVNESDNSVVVYGPITRYVPEDLARTLDANPAVKVVEFDSIGGRARPGRRIAELIRARGLDTRVSAKCLSACTVAFSGGRERIMRPRAVFGFHVGSVGKHISKSEGSRRTLIAAGVAPLFVARALRERKFWYPSIEEMRSAGFITVVSASL